MVSHGESYEIFLLKYQGGKKKVNYIIVQIFLANFAL